MTKQPETCPKCGSEIKRWIGTGGMTAGDNYQSHWPGGEKCKENQIEQLSAKLLAAEAREAALMEGLEFYASNCPPGCECKAHCEYTKVAIDLLADTTRGKLIADVVAAAIEHRNARQVYKQSPDRCDSAAVSRLSAASMAIEEAVDALREGGEL